MSHSPPSDEMDAGFAWRYALVFGVCAASFAAVALVTLVTAFFWEMTDDAIGNEVSSENPAENGLFYRRYWIAILTHSPGLVVGYSPFWIAYLLIIIGAAKLIQLCIRAPSLW